MNPEQLTPDFDGAISTRVVFGAESLAQIGKLARELGAKHVLLVTDPGIMAAGHETRTQQLLETEGLRVAIFDRVAENPTAINVDECAAFARDRGIDLL